jgi:hypothetical protein
MPIIGAHAGSAMSRIATQMMYRTLDAIFVRLTRL